MKKYIIIALAVILLIGLGILIFLLCGGCEPVATTEPYHSGSTEETATEPLTSEADTTQPPFESDPAGGELPPIDTYAPDTTEDGGAQGGNSGGTVQDTTEPEGTTQPGQSTDPEESTSQPETTTEPETTTTEPDVSTTEPVETTTEPVTETTGSGGIVLPTIPGNI